MLEWSYAFVKAKEAATIKNEENNTLSQKTIHSTFDHNFCKCRPIFNIPLLTDFLRKLSIYLL